MQEKEQIFSPIKQRVLRYIESLGISKRSFYEKTGISRGTLESKSGITEEILTRFIASYQNISPEWLLTGTEPIERERSKEYEESKAPLSPLSMQEIEYSSQQHKKLLEKEEPATTSFIKVTEGSLLNSYMETLIIEKDRRIEAQSKEIGRLEYKIETLSEENERIKDELCRLQNSFKIQEKSILSQTAKS